MPRHLRILLPICLAFASVLTTALRLKPVQAATTAATYTRGTLSLTIPYHAPHPGSGHLLTEILDPEDHILGHSDRPVTLTANNGSWRQSITPDQPIPFNDIVWQRVHYRFTYNDPQLPPIDGIESISEILSRPVVHILGQTEYLANSTAAIRAIVSDAAADSTTDTPQSGTLHIELLLENQPPRPLFTGRLNQRGTLEAQFHLPANITGQASLHYIADTPIGSTEYTQPIQLKDAASILLTTEKPLYQPGQTIHIRALALDRADHHAFANHPLTFEVEDSRGNKVFKSATSTDPFGIASAEFSLADEVNLGTYHLRALIGDPSAPSNTAELALNVQRYVLPKFKVAIDFTPSNGKPKRDYRPGDHVTGTLRANYFFGKPVDHAAITLKASGIDVAVFEAASASGKTDADGAYKFDLKLPAFFAGRPLNQGAAQALVEASVKDSADHTETHAEPITISQSSILVQAIPEGGHIIPHLENDVFLLTSYPDGSPASAALTIHSLNGEQRLATDPSGVAILHLHDGTGIDSLHIDADDHHGNRLTTDLPLDLAAGNDQLLLHTDRAILKPGDRFQLHVLSTRPHGSAYIDIVKNGQTILTRDVDLENGRADLTLTATPDMAGTLDVDAYLFGRDAQPIADHRLLFVQPAEELKIETSADAAVYKPGDDARIRFHVTNAHGEGVSAALGLQVVDEAVFALAEKQPGFAKVFFYLEQEVMKPRYEIHSLTLSNVVQPNPEPETENLDARALFSATELANPNQLDTEFGRSLPQDKFDEYQQRYRQAFTNQVRGIAAKLNAQPHPRNLVAHFQALAPRDAWNTPIHIESAPLNQGRNRFFLVRSAGPNQQLNDSDDLAVYLEEHTGALIPDPSQHPTTNLKIEHDRGPFNGFAQVSGTLTDQTGAIIPNATITLKSPTLTRSTRSNAAGQFSLASIPPGHYEASISSPGFQIVTTVLNLQPRDLAILTTTLPIGAETETVEVTSTAPMLPLERVHGVILGALQPMPAPKAPMAIGAEQFAAAGMTVDAFAVQDLPMQGRNFTLTLKSKSAAPETPTAHIRSWFPEALYLNPEILTDAHGNASIQIPIADSITTWRMALLASTQSGALGTGTASLKVFQPFFVDLDLPVTLTQGDHVSIPIALYNYAGANGNVTLKLQQSDWYSLDNDTPEKSVAVEPNRVGAAHFNLQANRIGKFKLTLTAHMDSPAGPHDDIVIREIEVIPNGQEQNTVFNGRLDSSTPQDHTLTFPNNAIPDATTLFVRLYPGPLSQVIEGMDGILRMPGGCFEQTSSSTYPNVLALDYMKRTKKLNPEVHAKAEGYIANGYQRLLTFEVPGGGFSWFGQAPANKILTAYGLMEFNDMSKVSDVDPKLIQRTAAWLASQQQPDGSWKPDSNFINEGATNRYNSNVLRITAYIAWSLANIGYQGPAVERAKNYIAQHTDTKPDPYTLAVIANFATDYTGPTANDRNFTNHAMQALIDARTEKDDQVFWSVEETGVYSTGTSAAIETTGLATQALLKWGQSSDTARKALNFLTSKKQADGNWGTTQATIMALRSLLLATQLSADDTRGTVTVLLNQKPVQTLQLTSANNDLLHQFVLKNSDPAQPSNLQLKFEGTGGLAYQIVGRYFIPWPESSANTITPEPLSISVTYDRTKMVSLAGATATLSIRNNHNSTANMVMVDLGIPPGFDLQADDLQAFQNHSSNAVTGRLEKFTQTSTQAILYFNSLGPNQTLTITYHLRAKYPIRAKTLQSRVYEYYDPAIAATAKPTTIEVIQP